MSTSSQGMAESLLLTPAGLTPADVEKALAALSFQQLDYADLFFESVRTESWVLDDGVVKEGQHSLEKGVGVRAVSQEKTGFAYSDDLGLEALLASARAARSIVRLGDSKTVQAFQKETIMPLYPSLDPVGTWSKQAKIELLQTVDRYARGLDTRVKQVSVSLMGTQQVVLIATTDRQWVTDVRPLVRLNVQVIVEQGALREQGFAGGGGRGDYESFVSEPQALAYAKQAVHQALINLEAKPAPAGLMPVVLGPGWPGVLLHEAVGHGLEGDFNRKGSSAFSGRIGEQVASAACTVVDDGTLPGRRGSLNVDDEGTPSQSTVLIENGILKGYLQDKLNARLMGMKPTGNGRREAYNCLPMPRMTNTYMLPGTFDPEEIIASVESGIYAVNFGGGQVDITSGKFVFAANEAYLIEKGKVTAPIKGATLVGHGPQVMQQISKVGHDLALDTGVGICGKDGQTVPVGVGQPTLLVDALTVGGTA